MLVESALTHSVFNQIKNALEKGLPDLDNRVEFQEWGDSGGGGILIDHGDQLTIKEFQYNEDGLRVAVTRNTGYTLLKVYTDKGNLKTVEQFLRSSFPCKAPPAKWPPSKLRVKFNRFVRKSGKVGVWIGILVLALMYGAVSCVQAPFKSNKAKT